MSAKESTPKPISRDDITRTVPAAAEKKALLDKDRHLEEENPEHQQHLEELPDEQTAELRNSEGRLGVLFEKAPDPYFLANLKGTFIDGNEAAQKLTGYNREELIGKSFLKLKLLSPKQIAKASTLLARNALGKDTGPDEFILSRKDGKQVPIEIRTRPVKIQGKRMVLGLVRDITVRKQAEEALGERVKELGCLYGISELIEKPGISLEEILQGAVDLIPTAWQYPEIACARIIVDGKKFDTENFGETIWKQASDILLHGERIGTIEVCYLEERDERDEGPFLKEERSLLNIVTKRLGHIIERKQAEEALRQTSQKIERLHQIAHDLEACEDEDQVYRLTVQAAERTLSFSTCTLDIVEEDRLVVKATSSASPPGASQEIKLKEGGLAAKTYRTKETTVFGRIEDVPEATPVREDIRSGISAPIGDIGVFQAVSTEPDAFTQTDARMIDLLLGHTYEAIRRIRLQEDLKDQAIHDPLTGVYNRRYFDETIETELQRSKRYDHPISFLMIDIDRFKEINDTFGHQMGDKVLQAVAELLSDQVRENDLVVRYGGDEFLIVLIETNGELQMITKRIQQAVARRNKENPLLDFPVTLSIGTARWEPKSDLTIEQVLAKADEKMYEEKRQKSNE